MKPFSFFRRFLAVVLSLLLLTQQVGIALAQVAGDLEGDVVVGVQDEASDDKGETIDDKVKEQGNEEIKKQENEDGEGGELSIDQLSNDQKEQGNEEMKNEEDEEGEELSNPAASFEAGDQLSMEEEKEQGNEEVKNEGGKEGEELSNEEEMETIDDRGEEEKEVQEDKDISIDSEQNNENVNNVQNDALKKGVRDRVKRANGTQDKAVEAQYGYVPPEPKKPVVSQEEKLRKVYEEVMEKRRRGELVRESELGQMLSVESLSAEYVAQFMKSFAKKAVDGEKPMKVKRSTIPGYLLQPRLGGSFAAQGVSSGGAMVAAQQAVDYVAERILVRSLRFLTDEEMRQMGQQTNTVIRRLQQNPFHLYRVDAKSGQSTIQLLQTFHGMQITQWVEPDYVYKVQAVPNDPLYAANQWQHNNIGGTYGLFSGGIAGIDMQSQDAWDIFTGNGSTLLAVVDTGLQTGHEDLDGNLWDGSGGCLDQNGAAISGGCPHSGFDFYDESVLNDGTGVDNNPSDEGVHGTEVAGMAVARGNNGVGVAGVNWNGKVMGLKTAGPATLNLSTAAISNATMFAIRNGAKVINMSFGGPSESPTLTSAIQFARDNGVLVVVAAGNDSLDLETNTSFPCETNIDNVICVAAHNPAGTISFGSVSGSATSNFGSTAVDVAAPGASVYSTTPAKVVSYINTFDTGNLTDFTFSATPGAPAADWGYVTSNGDQVLKSHVSGNYQDNEQSFATYSQIFDLTGVENAALGFELDCTAADSSLDNLLSPLDGITLEFSSDGGQNFEEMIRLNHFLGTIVAITTSANGLPNIFYGLKDRHLTNQFTFRFGFFSNADTPISIVGGGCTFDDVRIQSTSGSTYNAKFGTSFASPAVAGLATLIWDFKPSLTYLEVKQAIYNSVEVTPELTGKVATNGHVNAYRALALLADPAVTNLQGFKAQGGDQFNANDTVNSAAPHFTWTAPTDQGIISGYSFAVDAAPDATIDTTDLFTTLSSLADGQHTFSVSGISDVGVQGTQQDFVFTVDTQAPNTPTGLSVNSATNQVNDANMMTSSFVVSIDEDGEIGYSFSDGNNPNVTGTMAGTSGQNTITPVDLSSLDDGSITLTVTNTDAAGNVSTGAQLVIQKDTVADTPTNVQLNGGTVINKAAETNVSLTFTTTESGNVTYTITNGATNIQDTVSVGNGAQTINNIDVSTLLEGTLSISVTLTDDFGNTSGTGAGNVEKDTEVAVPTAVLLNGGNPITAANETSVSVQYTVAEAGTANFEVVDTGSGNVPGNLVAAGAGVQNPANVDVSGLNEGTLTFNVTFTDSAGNVSIVGSDTELKDTEVDAPTAVQLNGGATITQATAGSVSLTFTTTEAGNAMYTISNGGSNVQQTVSVGSGPQTINSIDVSGLGDGTLALSVILTDNVGNTSAAGVGNVQKDAIANAPTAVSLNNDQPITKANQNNVSLVFTVDELGTVAYSISAASGTPVVANHVASSTGVQTVSNLDLSNVGEGALTITTVLTDSVGNTSASGDAANTKDTVVNAPTNPLLNAGVVVNAGSAGNVSLAVSIDELGTIDYVISQGAGNVSGQLVAGSTGSQNIPNIDVSGLNDGTLNISVTLTDLVGNVSAAAVSQVDKDTEVDTPTNPLLNGGNVINGANQNAVDLTFSVNELGSVLYTVSDGTTNAQDTVTITSTGAQTISVNVSSLGNVSLTVSVTLTDQAGNTSGTAQSNVDKDAVVNDPTNLQLNGGITVNNVTQNAVDLTFSADETGMVAYTVSNAGGNANGSHTVTTPGVQTVNGLNVSGLDEGTINLSVQLTDDAGNVSQAVLGNEEKDTLVDDPVNVDLNGGVIINAATQNAVDLTFSVSETGMASYTISDGSTNLQDTVTITSTGLQTVTPLDVTPLGNGSLSFSVIFTDAAGNASNVVGGNILKDADVADPTGLQLNAGNPITALNQNSVDLTFSVAETGSVTYVISDGVGGTVQATVALGTAGAQTLAGIDVSQLADANLTITLDFTDTAGNTANQLQINLAKDTQVDAPTGLSFNNGNVVNAAGAGDVDLVFSVNETGMATYTITDDQGAKVDSTVPVGATGQFTVMGIDVSGLDDGVLTIDVTLTDDVGNVSTTASIVGGKDVLGVTPTNVQLNGGVTINQATQNAVDLTFEVTETGSVTYTISNGGSQVQDTIAVGALGTQTIQGIDVSNLADGTLAVSIVLTDENGNISLPANVNVEKDALVNPVQNVQLNGGVIINAANQSAVDLTFTTDEPGSVTYIISNAGSQVQDTVPVGSGAQTVNGVNVSILGDGTLSISVAFTDTAGNAATDANGNAQKDSMVDPASGLQLNGGVVINTNTAGSVDLIFTVNETGSATYTISNGAGLVTGQLVVGSAGVQTLSNIDVSGLNDGTLNISVDFTDTAGNPAATAAINLDKDTLVSPASAVQLNGGTVVNVQTGPMVALTFSVTEMGSAAYTISNGVSTVQNVVNIDTAGAQTVNNIDVSGLPDGTLSLSVVFTDTAGNEAAAGVGNVQKDAIAPDAPTNVVINGGNPLSAANAGNFSFIGTASESGTLGFQFNDGTNFSNVMTQAVSAGPFTITAQNVFALNDGNVSLQVDLTDLAGNVSDDTGVGVLKDTVANPVSAVVINGGNPLGFASVGDFGVSFTADEPGSAALTVTDGATVVNRNLNVTTAGAQTLNNVDVSGLNDGNLTFSLQLTDTVGNVSTATQVQAEKDTVLNDPTTFVFNGGAVLNSTQQANAGFTFSVSDLGTLTYQFRDAGSGTVDGVFNVTTEGAQNVSGIDLSSLQDGSLMLNYSFVDDFGNSSVNLPLTIAFGSKDTQVALPTPFILNDGRLIVNSTSNAVAGTFSVTEPGMLNFTIADQNSGVVNGTQLVTSGSFTSLSGLIAVSGVDLSSLQDDVLDVSATFTDDAGNVSAVRLTKALKGPGTPTIVALINDLSTFKSAGGSGSINFTALSRGTGIFRLGDQVGSFVSNVFDVTTTGANTVSGIDVSSIDTTQDVNVAIGFVTENGESDQNFDVTVTPNQARVSSGGGSVSRGRFGGASVAGGSNKRVVRDPNVNAGVKDLDDLKDLEDRKEIQNLGDQKEDVSPFTPPSKLEERSRKGPGVRDEEKEEDEKSPLERFFDLFSDKGAVMLASDMKRDDFAAAEVAYLRDLGIVKGLAGTDTFAGDQVIDRAQALKIALQLADHDVDVEVAVNPFADVQRTTWYAPIIQVAKTLGFVQGYDDGSFVPWQAVNRAEGLKLAYQILGIEVVEADSSFADVDTGMWYSKYLEDAAYRGLIAVESVNGEMFANPTADMTRAEFVYLIVQLSQNGQSELAMN